MGYIEQIDEQRRLDAGWAEVAPAGGPEERAPSPGELWYRAMAAVTALVLLAGVL